MRVFKLCIGYGGGVRLKAQTEKADYDTQTEENSEVHLAIRPRNVTMQTQVRCSISP